jgi:hypothetical protein
MKIARVRLTAAAALTLALALSGGLASASASASASAPRAPSGATRATKALTTEARPMHSHKVVVFNCRGRAKVRPRTFTIACADHNDYLTKLKWLSWGPVSAFGHGVEWTNDCVPNCASGTFRHHRVQVLFYRIRPVAITRMSTTSPGSRRTG